MTADVTTQGDPGDRPVSRAQRTAVRIAELPKVRGPFEAAGDLLRFSGRSLRQIPEGIRLYPEEAVRQAGYLVRSNAVVIFAMIFMLGAIIGITGTYLFESVGLDSYVAAIPAVPIMRGVLEIVFAWVFAAKAGCGIVAELGAMRITEEVDAMEVMGIRSIPYLVSNRLAATLGVMPLMFAAALLLSFLSQRLFFVNLLKAVSPGGFGNILWLFQGPVDFLIAVAWATILALIVTVVACYYGYNAKGGPVGVGYATAQSMLVNLVLTSLASMALAQVFYGGHSGTPIGT